MEHLNRLPTATEMRSEGGRGRMERQEKVEEERRGRRDKCKEEEVGRKRS